LRFRGAAASSLRVVDAALALQRNAIDRVEREPRRRCTRACAAR
jgi:hypothetical protein